MDEDLELISIYYGADITEEAAQKLKGRIEAEYPSCDIELQYGRTADLLLYYFQQNKPEGFFQTTDSCNAAGRPAVCRRYKNGYQYGINSNQRNWEKRRQVFSPSFIL